MWKNSLKWQKHKEKFRTFLFCWKIGNTRCCIFRSLSGEWFKHWRRCDPTGSDCAICFRTGRRSVHVPPRVRRLVSCDAVTADRVLLTQCHPLAQAPEVASEAAKPGHPVIVTRSERTSHLSQKRRQSALPSRALLSALCRLTSSTLKRDLSWPSRFRLWIRKGRSLIRECDAVKTSYQCIECYQLMLRLIPECIECYQLTGGPFYRMGLFIVF